MATVEAVFALNGALRRELDVLLAALELTVPLADALWALGATEEPQPRRALAERLHCDPSNVTFLADRLEERGLITRVADPADRRVKALALTDEGRAVRERFAGAFVAALGPGGPAHAEARRLSGLLPPSAAGGP
jgi:DNA-binding MarR family transcriptional regulator